MTHLKKWWLAYGGIALGVAHNVWPTLREYVCSHPIISGSTVASLIIAALVKESPTKLPVD